MSVMAPDTICRDSLRREAVLAINAQRDNAQVPLWNGIDFVVPVIEQPSGRPATCTSVQLHLFNSLADAKSLQSAIALLDARGRPVPDSQVQIEDQAASSELRFVRANGTPLYLPEGIYYLQLDVNALGVDVAHTFDPTAARARFEVRSDVTEVDPRTRDECPPPDAAAPRINYLARDFQSLRQVILDRIALTMPDWRERHMADLGVTLVELLAYLGDHLSYYQDAVATEAYVQTARSRISVRRHARLVDYTLHEGCNARTFLQLDVARDLAIDPQDVYFITPPRNPELAGRPVLAHHELEFERPGSYLGFELVPIPLGGCVLEERHCVNWLGFATLLAESQHAVLNWLRERIPVTLLGELRTFLRQAVDGIAPGLLRRLITALDVVLRQSLISAGREEYWPASVVAQVRAALRIAPDAVPQVNRALLQLLFPTYFVFCRAWDGQAVGEPPELRSLIDPELAARKIPLYEGHNAIQFYTWDEQHCSLPRGATRATLVDADRVPYASTLCDSSELARRHTWERRLRLKPGDLLLLREKRGPQTGNIVDADPAQRQVVRLTRVNYTIDPVRLQPICEIEWSYDDRLRFPLCLSSTTSAPGCRLLTDVSIAQGNVLLADHGVTIAQPEWLGAAPAASGSGKGCCSNALGVCAGQAAPSPAMQLSLNQPDLTFATPVSACQSAATLSRQRAHHAVPALELVGIPVDPLSPVVHADQPRAGVLSIGDLATAAEFRRAVQIMSDEARWTLLDLLPAELDDVLTAIAAPGVALDDEQVNALQALLAAVRDRLRWRPRPHLMDSAPHDQHFTVEVDDQRRVLMRFGNGFEGRRPADEMTFWARYRVGNGAIGNLGQDKLQVLVYRNVPVSGIRGITNPLPASGGVEPESMRRAKLHAPYAFRSLRRAILPEDYRELVLRDFAAEVQQVRATPQQVGVLTMISVAVDPLGGVTDPDELNDRIQQKLRLYARMGHEIDVRPPIYVPLRIAADITVRSGYLKGEIHRELQALFGTGRLPNGRPAFFHPDQLTFGDSIYLSRIVAAAMTVPGVAGIQVHELRRLSEPEGGPEAEQHLADGVLTLREFEIPVIDRDPARPASGELVFNLRGGR